MKTSVIMQREMGGLSIRQDTKNSFFNATDLIKLYNLKNNEFKRIESYSANDSTKRFMDALAKDEVLNSKNSCYLENGLMLTKRGKNGGTWMHPYLFIDFAMWLSPEFKVTVIRWVYDNLIKLRHEAGDSFKDVNEALFEKYPNSSPDVYRHEASMINYLSFGSYSTGQRNLANEDQLNLLKRLQKADIKLIKEGKSFYERQQELIKFKKYL